MKRCEEYVISLLEQCEDLREVETFLQTRQDIYAKIYTNQARCIQREYMIYKPGKIYAKII